MQGLRWHRLHVGKPAGLRFITAFPIEPNPTVQFNSVVNARNSDHPGYSSLSRATDCRGRSFHCIAAQTSRARLAKGLLTAADCEANGYGSAATTTAATTTTAAVLEFHIPTIVFSICVVMFGASGGQNGPPEGHFGHQNVLILMPIGQTFW